MAEFAGTYDKEDVKYIIGLVQESWNAQFNTLQSNQAANFKRLEDKVDLIVSEMVHKKEFEDYKQKIASELNTLKSAKEAAEKTVNLLTILKENWKLFLGIFFAGAAVMALLVFVVIYAIFTPKTQQISAMADEVHVIAQYHQKHRG